MRQIVCIFLFISLNAYSQKKWDVSIGHSSINGALFHGVSLKGAGVKGMFHFNNRWLLKLGFQVNYKEYERKGNTTNLTSALWPITYYGPFNIKGTIVDYRIPLEMEYVFKPANKFSISPQAGYMGQFAYNYYDANPDLSGRYGKGRYYLRYYNFLTLVVTIKYDINKRFGLFNSTKFDMQIFKYFHNGYYYTPVTYHENFIGVYYTIN